MNRRETLMLGMPLLGLTGCLRRQQTRIADDTLIIAVPSDPAGIDPAANLAEVIGSEIILNIFDTLLAWTPDPPERLTPRLALAWHVSDDRLAYRFTLRPDVRFHDGTLCDGAAVAFALRRSLEANSYFRASMDALDRIVVLAPDRVEFRLKRPCPFFPALLAQPQAAIVSPAAVRALGPLFSQNPVGTGAFRFGRRETDVSLTLIANPHYFRGAPRLSRLVYQIVSAPSTRRMMLENGEIDLCHQSGQLAALPIEDVEAFRHHPSVTVIEQSSQILRQLEFNNLLKNSPVHDLRVRRAIAHAIDTDGLAGRVLRGTVERAWGPLPTANMAFDPSQPGRAPVYDPNMARHLLAEAGFAAGSLSFDLITFSGSLWATVATFLQANLAAVGIGLNIVQMEFPALRARHTKGDFMLALDGRSPWYNDPDAHITTGYLSSRATSAMTFRMPPDQALDQAIIEAQSESDPARRNALYHQLQATISERVPAVYLFSNKIIAFASKRLRGLHIGSTPPLTEYHGVSKIDDKAQG